MLGAAPTAAECFTVGYEGRRVDELLDSLATAGVEQVIDVRERAQSRKPGFSGKSLRAELSGAGISYKHIPELGSPSHVRATYRATGDFETFSECYRDHLRRQRAFLTLVLELIAIRRTALLCFERDSGACHRSLICKELESAGLSFTHL
jgi:uncharacterized protein (DUF488 family)